tara:strand:+ start:631 stop:861 length:231 start_codon:yes stop_codon:yes gene_type:complete
LTEWTRTWVINASLAATDTTHSVLEARVATEATEIAKRLGGFATRHAVVPRLAEDPVGANRLRAPVEHDVAAALVP